MLTERWLLHLLLAGALVLSGAADGAGLRSNCIPAIRHYFLWRGQPTVLITSGEHYGAVLNADFDYVKYLDTLAADKLNLTRTWTGGTYCEPPSGSISRGTRWRRCGAVLCPFARSGSQATRAAGIGSTWSDGTRTTSSGSATSWRRRRARRSSGSEFVLPVLRGLDVGTQPPASGQQR